MGGEHQQHQSNTSMCDSPTLFSGQNRLSVFEGMTCSDVNRIEFAGKSCDELLGEYICVESESNLELEYPQYDNGRACIDAGKYWSSPGSVGLMMRMVGFG